MTENCGIEEKKSDSAQEEPDHLCADAGTHIPRSPVRVQLSRAKGWRMPPDTMKVDRSTKWGNPRDWRDWRENWPAHLPITPTHSDQTGRDRWCKEQAVQAFKEDLAEKFLCLPLDELRGKNLACWCKPYEWCHADVLLELANTPSPSPTPEADQP